MSVFFFAACASSECCTLSLRDALPIFPAVGVAGVSVWKEHMHRCFADIPRIIICTDNDEHLEQKDHEGNPVNRGQQLARSEERRVGKECRSRWWAER